MNIDSQEENSFNELYSHTLKMIMRTNPLEEEDLKNAYLKIKDSFKNFNHATISFSEFKIVCAYFYTYSFLNSAVARNRFFDAIQNCGVLKNVIRKPCLNIISLGGGPGTDMIGFLSALHESVADANKTLNLTIVDKWVRWASFYNINEYLIREFDYGNVSKLFQLNNICSTFMCVDLNSSKPPRKYRYDLSVSDIVLLVRVLDICEDENVILQNIVRRMKSGALLLLIDSYTREINGMEKIYASNIGEFCLSVSQTVLYDLYPGNRSKAEIAVYVKNARPLGEQTNETNNISRLHDGEDITKKKRQRTTN